MDKFSHWSRLKVPIGMRAWNGFVTMLPWPLESLLLVEPEWKMRRRFVFSASVIDSSILRRFLAEDGMKT